MAEGACLDQWARWVLRSNSELERMYPTRDRVLANADIRPGDSLLDVGTGSGLIGFGAVPLVREQGRVIFTDVSEALVDHCRREAAERGLSDRCQFVVAPADDLTGIDDESVDIVTTRSVLIYVEDKARAFREFFRVLRPGGRLSTFEPINSFDYPWPKGRFFGYDVAPVSGLAEKVMSVYDRLQPPNHPMLDFDERDLLVYAEEAGFAEIRLVLEVEITSRPWAGGPWGAFLRTAGNPCVPPLEQVLDEALTAEEKDRFCEHLRPLVERGEGENRIALAYLWATRP